MKLFNLFKKETKKVAKSNLQKLEKNQLEKVIGGADLTSTSRTVGAGQVVEVIK